MDPAMPYCVLELFIMVQIDVVMVSCSSFAPTPSMAAMLVNKFRMRSEVLTYAFAGMGCASALVCVDLAKNLLKALPNKTVLIINHENVTSSWYQGKDRSMMTNCLFRLGGAAAILSNRCASSQVIIFLSLGTFSLLHSCK